MTILNSADIYDSGYQALPHQAVMPPCHLQTQKQLHVCQKKWELDCAEYLKENKGKKRQDYVDLHPKPQLSMSRAKPGTGR